MLLMSSGRSMTYRVCSYAYKKAYMYVYLHLTCVSCAYVIHYIIHDITNMTYMTCMYMHDT